jgi:hypothetical protein
MNGASTARTLLPNLSSLNQYYKDSDQVFGTFTEFLCSPIKLYFCMNEYNEYLNVI